MIRPGRLLLATTGLAGAAAIVVVGLTWPLFRNPAATVLDSASLYGGASVLVQRDINLTMWVLAWDAHALATAPLRLFHANAFYPAPYTLALSENMLGNVPLFAPVYWATGNVVLAHQATLLATFVLAALAMAAYAYYWTRDAAASAAAGMLFAFAPFRVWQLGNLHVVAIQWLPLVPLGIDATLDRRLRGGGPALLAAALALSTLCSFYTGYAAFALAGAYLLVALWVRGRAALRRLPATILGFGLAAVAVGLVSIPYLILQRDGVLPDRSGGAFNSMGFLGVLKLGPVGVTSYFLWPRRDGVPQFLGFTTLALALVGLAGWRRAPRGALAAATLAGWLLCLGPNLLTPWGLVPLPYSWLVRTVPGFSAMRVPQRFGCAVTVAVVALAALGLARLRVWSDARGHRPLARLLPWLAVACLLVEVRPDGLRAVAVDATGMVPPEYRWLATHGAGGALLELPASTTDLYRQSVYMYYSTVHWLPTANGYTPYPPRAFVDVMSAAGRLPDPGALATALDRAPFRWVLVHVNRIEAGKWPAWEATLATRRLRLAADFGNARVYEVAGAHP